jgi:1-pyrroline-4-hydroxy-2-carboxylate deaminase
MIQWQGVFPALTTPFTADGKLDLSMFEKNLDAQIQAGVHGLIIGGSLGEASTIKPEEKEQLTKTAIARAGEKIPVVVNIAESSTADAIRQTRNAETWGAQGLMLLPPMRYKSDPLETLTYFKSVAASTELPIMIYNNPVDYGIEVSLDMFEELTVVENVQAVKDSTRDVSNITRMINRFGDRYSLLCGVDTIAMEELCMGADGWVAGLVNAFPRETTVIFELVKQGRIEEARKINRWFLPLLELDIHPKLVQYIKLAQSLTGLGSEYVRAPRLILTGLERETVMSIIQEGISSRPVLPGIHKTERRFSRSL